MKYVITGGAGNTAKTITENLLNAGHNVTVIGRHSEHLAHLIAKGAHAAIGSVEDVEFLKKAFAEADAVYTMAPPNHSITSDWKGYIEQIGKNYAAAIKNSRIKYVVNLSSIGAHLEDGCGPVTGLHRVEEALNTLANVAIKHLRPSYFYQNLLANTGLVKHMSIIGSNFSVAAGNFPIVDPADIAAVATEELLNHDFKGHTVRYIASDETGTNEIASALGQTIGKPDLKWIQFSDADALKGMLQAGLTEEIAKNYIEMGQALHTGKMTEDYQKNHPGSLGKIKLEDFAKQFAAVYNAN
jgi:uncharacterized protein YbjT (DUF2867 family)